MKKTLIFSLSAAALLTGGVAYGLSGACLEIYCANKGCDNDRRGCCTDSEYQQTGAFKCLSCPSGEGWTSSKNGTDTTPIMDGAKDTGCRCDNGLKWESTKQKCVECISHSDCQSKYGNAKPICNSTTNTCDAGCLFNNTVYANNTTVGNCGKCLNGTVEADTTLFNNLCQTCTAANNWNKQNKTNGTAVGNCGKCQGGAPTADTTKYNTGCQTCTADNSWNKQNKTNGTAGQDACHTCQNGADQLTNTNQTVVCGTMCCATGKVCSQNASGNSVCSDPCQSTGELSSRYTYAKDVKFKGTSGSTLTSTVEEFYVSKVYTPSTNMFLNVRLAGIVINSKLSFSFYVYDKTKKTYLISSPSIKYQNLSKDSGKTKVYGFDAGSKSGETWGSATYELQAGHQYQIYVDMYTICDKCSVRIDCD